ncbi:hypothetical protein [Maridesulfovibrio sp. FT414]|uniref:hypothetical protein n=1 Tax=Maridesulfovibrio sp. FT414 TaxID=2979469 RepID=UPI003D80235D
MRRHVLALIIVMVVVQFAACTTKTVKVDGFSSPESVTSDGTYFYVSNVGEKLNPTDRDGDGYISKLTAEGSVVERRYVTGLNAPKGMAVQDGILYVADIDRIKGFDLSDGKKVFELDFSADGTSFLNDIAVYADKQLLVSATDTGNVYLVNTGENPSFSKLESDMDLFGPNGIAVDQENGDVYIASFGKDHKPNGFVSKGRIVAGKIKGEKVFFKDGFYDGIALHDGKVIVSDWIEFKKSGVLIQVDPKNGKSSTLELEEKIGGPADFYLDAKGKRLWIPMMLENKLLIVGLK